MQLPATLTLTQANGALDALRAALAQAPAGAPFIVDGSALADYDTSAIAVLLEARREAMERAVAFELHAAPPKLRQLAALYGVEGLLGLTPDAAAAAPSAG